MKNQDQMLLESLYTKIFLKENVPPSKFRELQDIQRGTPESMFNNNVNPGAGNSQLYQYAMEHTGDLIHRVAYMDDVIGWGGATGVDYGMSVGQTKVNTVLRIKNDILRGEIESQARDNWKYRSQQGDMQLSEEEFIKQMQDAGKRYAEVYRQLKPITKAQKVAQDATIALGEGDYSLWVKKVEELKNLISTRKGYLETI